MDINQILRDNISQTGCRADSVAGKNFHFIGIGGIGMSGLAKMLISNKALVSGSDMNESPVTSRLQALGCDIKQGHSTGNITKTPDAVVISAAINDTNPELIRAKALGCPIYKYAHLLGAVMDSYQGIAVAGTHGKSTTTGWLVSTMKAAGMDPNFIIGADISNLKTNSDIGKGENFIVEACEYDRSFLNLRPKIACVLNIEQDHLDYYSGVEEIISAFADFTSRIKENGSLIINGDDPNASRLACSCRGDIDLVNFGLNKNCRWRAYNIELKNGCYQFDILKNGDKLGRANISMPGKHNILNALAVIAIAEKAGADPAEIIQHLDSFTGIDRRLMFKTKIDDITIVDDYAHHPTEIRASLQAIREKFNPQRLWCVFQPHQYSRTRFLLDDFAESFKLADITILPEIYFVRDDPASRELVNSKKLVDKINSNGSRAVFLDGFSPICEYLKQNVAPGDLVVTMGAGDIWKVADEYIQWLGRNC